MKELKYEHQNSYDVVIFHFMNTHRPIEHIQSHSVTIHILWMAHGVGGDGKVGGFMGWGVGGWLEGSWGGWVCGGLGGGGVHGGVNGWRAHVVGAYTHPPIVTMLKYLILWIPTHPPTHPSNISKVLLCHYTYTLMVHGMGCGWWWVVGGFMGWLVVV